MADGNDLAMADAKFCKRRRMTINLLAEPGGFRLFAEPDIFDPTKGERGKYIKRFFLNNHTRFRSAASILIFNHIMGEVSYGMLA